MWLSAFLLLAAAPVRTLAFGRTFGVGYTPDMGWFCPGQRFDTVVLNYTVSPGASHAVLHHFWATGPQFTIDRIWVSFFLDGELQPSISFQPGMVCGVGFPDLLAPEQLFSAGGLCGKGAAVGGFYNTIPIPFRRSVLVTVRPSGEPQDGNCTWGYINLRGTENLPLVLPHSGIPLPQSARLQLWRNDWAVRQPLEYVNITSVGRGKQGVVFLTSLAVSAKPVGGSAAGGGYIEGCWQFYGTWNTSFPGLVVGTGVEDYFDSSYYFGADTFLKQGRLSSSPLSGLTVFDRSADGQERLSAYRVHAADPLAFTDGGRLVWQVGGQPGQGRTKCGAPLRGSASEAAGALPGVGRELSAVSVASYAWAYTWPADALADAPRAPGLLC